MKKGSLWVCIVVLVFGLLMFVSSCQKQEAPSEQPAVTESAAPPAPEAAPPATTGGTEAPAPAGSAQ
jgi:hypothetical protein